MLIDQKKSRFFSESIVAGVVQVEGFGKHLYGSLCGSGLILL